jgi:Domain of unknown function (DUF1844)
MSNSPSETAGGDGTDQKMAALFASMVIQNTNMALIFLGQAPHPQSGQTTVDLEHATYFIDQLEMLAVKTKGNLDKQEEGLLKQSLTHLRMAFVEAFQNPPKTEAPAAAPAAPPVDEQEMPVAEPILPGEKAAESESRKKFSKKY